MIQPKSKEDSSSEIYILRLTVKSASDFPLAESYVKVSLYYLYKRDFNHSLYLLRLMVDRKTYRTYLPCVVKLWDTFRFKL